MAFQEAKQNISVEAGSDLSARQFRFVTINSSGKLAVTAAGADSVGVLQNDPDEDGKAGTVQISGVSKVEAGGAITAGDTVSSDSQGRAVANATGDVVLGEAMEAASGSGSIIGILIRPGRPEPVA